MNTEVPPSLVAQAICLFVIAHLILAVIFIDPVRYQFVRLVVWVVNFFNEDTTSTEGEAH